MKRYDLLINTADLELLLNKMCEAGLQIYDEKGNRIKRERIKEKAQERGSFWGLTETMITEKCFSLLKKEDIECIYLVKSSPFVMGAISINNQHNDALSKVFRMLTRVIKNNYILSYDRQFYIGPGAFSDWIQKKTTYPFTIIQAKYFDVCMGVPEFIALKAFIEGKKAKIYPVESDLRNASEKIEIGSDFLTCSAYAQLQKYQKKWKQFYTTESDAVFLFFRKKQNGTWLYRILIDIRNCDSQESDGALYIYKELFAFCTEKHYRIIRTHE